MNTTSFNGTQHIHNAKELDVRTAKFDTFVAVHIEELSILIDNENVSEFKKKLQKVVDEL